MRYDAAERSRAAALGIAIQAMAGERLTGLQLAKLQRASQLLPRARVALSDFEADLVEEVCERAACSKTATITEHEWHVIDTSIDAMDRLLEAAPKGGR